MRPLLQHLQADRHLGLVAPFLNMVLGTALTISVFTRDHDAADTMLAGFYLGPLIVIFSAMSLAYRGVRFAVTGAGLTLAVLTFFLPQPPDSLARLSEVACGLIVAAFSLLPNYEFPPHLPKHGHAA